jgi:prephenate dehydrogenase
MINHLVIIGVGSIGASLGLALRQAGAVKKITGVGRGEENLKVAQQRGAIDDYTSDAAEAVKTADVVFLSVPMGTMKTVLTTIQPTLPETAIVTDGGSSKGSVINDFNDVFGSTKQFVPGHPIAGTEKSGASAALWNLYNSRRVILTPTPDTPAEDLHLIREMWKATGAIVEEMSAEHHDDVLAATSHLPHMLAFGLVDSLSRMDDVQEIFRYAAGGFRDFTRIASSDPTMWRDICVHNREAILKSMDRYVKDMHDIYDAVDKGDADELMAIFSRAKATRDQFLG